MIFADASALVAIMTGETGARQLSEALDTDPDRTVSALVVWESVASLCRSYGFSVPAARRQVDGLLDLIGFRLLPIGAMELELAIAAYARYGKGRHAAALNLGDCFAYACAKANDASLLYTGRDFEETDIVSAA